MPRKITAAQHRKQLVEAVSRALYEHIGMTKGSKLTKRGYALKECYFIADDLVQTIECLD